MPSHPAIPHRCGKATPQRRDESACNTTATQVRARKSLQKMEPDGQSVERAIRYHGHGGLSGHKRELLIVLALRTSPVKVILPLSVCYTTGLRHRRSGGGHHAGHSVRTFCGEK